MTGLIYKDFLALKGHLTTYLVFFLVYGGLCLSGVFTASVLCGMVVLMSLITPMTTVTSDDVSRWNRFAIATPACRRGVVTGKYLFTLLVTLASTVFVSLLLVVLALAGGLEEPLSELLLSALACAGIALIMNAVALPLLLKFGAEKARMVSMALFLLVFAGFALRVLALATATAATLFAAESHDAMGTIPSATPLRPQPAPLYRFSLPPEADVASSPPQLPAR